MEHYQKNPILLKSYQFSLEIISIIQTLQKRGVNNVLIKQILSSGTSIGANLEEAKGGFSRRDFLYKITTAYKEARETKYWLNLLYDSEYLNDEEFNSLFDQCDQIAGTLYKIIQKTKNG